LAHTDTAEPSPPHPSGATRRDFLYIATGAVATVGLLATIWPFIDQMNPDAAALALATVDVDITSLQPGSSMTVKWRGKPVFIRYRTDEEVAEAKAVPLDQLKDPVARNDNLPSGAQATDENRAAPGTESILIMVGICTHLGCVPLGQQGAYNGWFCPCHGSEYDTAGRIRQGPAPENLLVPEYRFLENTAKKKVVRLGEKGEANGTAV
jgi:ubiquinol-cytochrome c reductase iron-sulfur subunit